MPITVCNLIFVELMEHLQLHIPVIKSLQARPRNGNIRGFPREISQYLVVTILLLLLPQDISVPSRHLLTILWYHLMHFLQKEYRRTVVNQPPYVSKLGHKGDSSLHYQTRDSRGSIINLKQFQDR